MANRIVIGDDEPITKGDTLNLQATLSENITGWKIRAEVFDNNGQCVRYASSLVIGGASSQIEIVDAINGVFIVHIIKGDTKNFADKGFIEIEIETSSSPTEKFTVVRGEDTEIIFRNQKIDWDNKT